MVFKDFGARSAWLVAALAILLIVALIGTRLSWAAASDRRVASREETVVRNGLHGWVSETEGRVVGQTTWDDAVLNLGVRYNPAWAHKNVGRFLHDVSGFEDAYVLDRANAPIYAMRSGAETPVESYASARPAASRLVARVRDDERLRNIDRRRPGGAPAALGPAIQASTFALIDGTPNIVTATLVQPDFGKYDLPDIAPIIVTDEAMDAGLLKRFGDRFLLTDLRRTPPGETLARGVAQVTMFDLGGRPIGRLSWTPQAPSRLLLRRSVPAIGAVLLAFCAVASALFLRGRQAVRSLVASESQAKHLAYHDTLTGLPNRAMFSERMEMALADLRRTGRTIGLVALDLDRFKQINDTHGHGSGDLLIIDVAGRLKGLARETDTVVRLGGDEFLLLCAEATPHGLASLAERIVAALAEPFDLPCGRIFSGASIGVTVIAQPGVDSDEALRQADLAMYRAKEGGRGRFEFFEPEMDLALKARRSLETDLRQALAANEIYMVYQPQVDGQGRTIAVEALARWNHKDRGPMSPSFFIPIAEECGLIDALGEFTLRRAFADSLRWPDLRVAVNVSARQMRDAGFPERVSAILKETGADVRRLELEITEGLLLGDDEATHRTLNRLRAMGFSLALDDFGTGYSSLAYLRRYPVDKIKIDRSFVTSLGVDRESEAVVGAIVKLARALNLRVIAEGVETEVQREGLRRAGCSEIQGFLYSKALGADDVHAFVRVTGRSRSRRGAKGARREAVEAG